MLQTLRDRLDTVTYDKNYQNIDILGIVGYDNSAPTWSKITSFPITWSGATVIDLGCFHGYFSIRAKEAGASRVIGLEQSAEVIETTRQVVECSDSDVELVQWRGGEVTPEADIALVLNMLHHCDDQSLTLQNINCAYAVFEVNQDQISTIDRFFKILEMREGRSYPARESRILIYAQKR
tara:strand:+ start:6668 stop:7207 length:540 start_codon:yes stop_codon:yes gene_type:complete